MSRQREWMTGLLESLPSIVFLVLWRGGADAELSGWVGSGLAAALLVGFWLRRTHCNPVMLGINLHLLAITPMIVTLFRLGAPETARLLLAYAENGLLVAILIVGCALTAFSSRGFIGVDGMPPTTRRTYSVLLLAMAAAGIAWSFAHADSTLMKIGVPLMTLFGLRRYLVARWSDRAEPGRSLAAGALPVGDTG